MPTIKTCPVCGTAFINGNGQKKYCSRRCSQRARNGIAMQERTCPECGKVFATFRSDQVYCSHICTERRWNRVRREGYMQEHPPKNPTMYMHTCPECGKEYVSHKKRQVCCSKECAGRHSCRMHGGTPKEKQPKMPKDVQRRMTLDEKVAAAQATWGSAAFDAQDQDSMIYGNMLYM